MGDVLKHGVGDLGFSFRCFSFIFTRFLSLLFHVLCFILVLRWSFGSMARCSELDQRCSRSRLGRPHRRFVLNHSVDVRVCRYV